MKARLFRCSPHAGVTDRLGDLFAAGLTSKGIETGLTALRDYRIKPCAGCNKCASAPYACVLEAADDVISLYEQFMTCNLAVFMAPIYFYALPAHFKAFIDRSQLFWNKNHAGIKTAFPPALVILAGARAKGRLLFSGALLCLKYFLLACNSTLLKHYVFYGLEDLANLHKRKEIEPFLYKEGQTWAERIARRF